ncbi:hypothetical protein R3P38DRAFT_2803835 [Favolaschia claudopus]|uniref:Uncharacterized protein n=1 Tax=Favolaschia claudopus TaxID=2862362 RepID=A0AAV9ZS44_9AGAR
MTSYLSPPQRQRKEESTLFTLARQATQGENFRIPNSGLSSVSNALETNSKLCYALKYRVKRSTADTNRECEQTRHAKLCSVGPRSRAVPEARQPIPSNLKGRCPASALHNHCHLSEKQRNSGVVLSNGPEVNEKVEARCRFPQSTLYSQVKAGGGGRPASTGRVIIPLRDSQLNPIPTLQRSRPSSDPTSKPPERVVCVHVEGSSPRGRWGRRDGETTDSLSYTYDRNSREDGEGEVASKGIGEFEARAEADHRGLPAPKAEKGAERTRGRDGKRKAINIRGTQGEWCGTVKEGPYSKETSEVKCTIPVLTRESGKVEATNGTASIKRTPRNFETTSYTQRRNTLENRTASECPPIHQDGSECHEITAIPRRMRYWQLKTCLAIKYDQDSHTEM